MSELYIPTYKNRTSLDTCNILDLYLYAAGRSEIPERWHIWTCLALLAASVGNRVYYRKFRWSTLQPNLYVFLVGPSGASKGAALDFGLQFYHTYHNMLHGAPTYKALVDFMASENDHDGPKNNQLLLVQAELGNAIGVGQLADAFVKQMTDLYTTNTSVPFQEITRKHGDNTIKEGPCVTWLAGTTPDWLGDSVSEQSLRSGFFGRVVPVFEDYNFDLRVHDPSAPENSPEDYDDVIGYIWERIDDLCHWEGQMLITPEAKAMDRQWYDYRPAPETALEPMWKREHDLVLKVATLLSLCESFKMVIEVAHWRRARKLITDIFKDIPEVLRRATGTKFDAHFERVREYFIARKGKWIKRKRLVSDMNRYHIRAAELEMHISELKQLEVLSEDDSNRVRRYCYDDNPRIHRLEGGEASGDTSGI